MARRQAADPPPEVCADEPADAWGGQTTPPSGPVASPPRPSLRLPPNSALLDVGLELSVEIARQVLPLGILRSLDVGMIVKLDKSPLTPLTLRVNGLPIARGVAVTLGEKFGYRVQSILATEERAET